jgi:hypothetical protein
MRAKTLFSLSQVKEDTTSQEGDSEGHHLPGRRRFALGTQACTRFLCKSLLTVVVRGRSLGIPYSLYILYFHFALLTYLFVTVWLPLGITTGLKTRAGSG